GRGRGRGDPCRAGRRIAASLLRVHGGACALVCCPRRGGSLRSAAYLPPGECAFHIRCLCLCRPPVPGATSPQGLRQSAMQRKEFSSFGSCLLLVNRFLSWSNLSVGLCGRYSVETSPEWCAYASADGLDAGVGSCRDS